MSLKIASNPISSPLVAKPLFPQIDREELGNSFAPMDRYQQILKGLSCGFSWAVLMSPSVKSSSLFSSSRAAIKLSSSTFCIPKFVKQTLDLYDCAGKFGSCVQSRREGSKQFNKMMKATANLFLASMGFLNTTSKVLCCLDKTRVIDLTLIASDTRERLDDVAFVTSLPALLISIYKLGSLIKEYQNGSPKVEKVKVEPGLVSSTTDRRAQDNDLLVKIAIKTFKLFCSVVGFIAFFLPNLIDPGFALFLSTISFGLGLGTSVGQAEVKNPTPFSKLTCLV